MYSRAQLSDELPCPQNGFAGHGRCNSSGDFLLQLQAVLDQRRSTRRAARALAGQSEGTDDGEETAYVVVDRADRLRALPDSVLRILLRLGELVSCSSVASHKPNLPSSSPPLLPAGPLPRHSAMCA